MKIFKIFALLAVVFSFSACETYGDPDVKYNSIGPIMSGDWVVRILDVQADTVIALDIDKDGRRITSMTIYTTNTASESTTEMLLGMGLYRSTSAPTIPSGIGSYFSVKGKVSINKDALTFSVENAVNAYKAPTLADNLFTLTDGKIVLKGATTPANREKQDAISFTISTLVAPGRTYEVKGFRRTLWDTDEPHFQENPLPW